MSCVIYEHVMCGVYMYCEYMYCVYMCCVCMKVLNNNPFIMIKLKSDTMLGVMDEIHISYI